VLSALPSGLTFDEASMTLTADNTIPDGTYILGLQGEVVGQSYIQTESITLTVSLLPNKQPYSLS